MPSGAKPATQRTVDVRVYPAFRSDVKAAFVRKAARAGLAVGDAGTPSSSPFERGRREEGSPLEKGRTGQGAVSIVIADDETLRELNREFRGFDEVTDVLSFGDESDASLTPEDAEFPEFPDIPDEPSPLGEIVLSYPLAVKQASQHNVTVEEEVALLIVHGVLHLLGHDHAEPEEEATMKALEAKALAVIFPERGTSA